MSSRALIAIGVLVWGGVFVLQALALLIVSDMERRWDEAWAIEWERKNGRSIDELIEQIAGQIRGWRLARRLLNVYLIIALAVMIAIGFVQWRGWVMTGPEFMNLMRFLLVITGFLFMPLWAAAWIGLGVVETAYRQVRVATGERIEITSAGEVDRYPKPEKPGKAPKVPPPRPKS